MIYGGSSYGALEYGGMFVFAGVTFLYTGSGIIIIDGSARVRFLGSERHLNGLAQGEDFWKIHDFPEIEGTH